MKLRIILLALVYKPNSMWFRSLAGIQNIKVLYTYNIQRYSQTFKIMDFIFILC